MEFVLPKMIFRSKLSPAQCSLTMVYAYVSITCPYERPVQVMLITY